MIFKPSPLSRITVDDQELVPDKKSCRKIGPCGVGKKALYLNFFEIQCLFYNTILPKEIILVSLKSFHIGCPIGTIPVGCADHIFGSILIDVLTKKSYFGGDAILSSQYLL